MGGDRAHIVESVSEGLESIRYRRPLIHNITNYVVMNFTANALLSLGASPVMAHAVEEVEEMAGLAGALVVNIGTLSSPWVDAMFKAVKAARARSIPIVLDPVGAGATKFRTDVAWRLAQEPGISVIRGNGSEIMALAGRSSTTKGVDSSLGSEEAFEAALEFASSLGTVVAVTGKEDFITDGTRMARVSNGHQLMGRVTGTGCSASSITGAFCAVEADPFIAATGALITFGIAGEMAAATSPRPGTFGTLLLDALDAVTTDEIKGRARVAISALA